MNIPTLEKARSLEYKDIKRPYLMHLGYIILIVGIIYSIATTLLLLLPVFIVFSFCMIYSIDWSVD